MITNGDKMKIGGREYKGHVLVLRKRKIVSKGKEYYQYYISVPKKIAEEIVKEAGMDDMIPLVVYMAVGEWYHLLDWSKVGKRLKDKLPEEVKKELLELGLLGDGNE